jgi:hypothetical protein
MRRIHRLLTPKVRAQCKAVDEHFPPMRDGSFPAGVDCSIPTPGTLGNSNARIAE